MQEVVESHCEAIRCICNFQQLMSRKWPDVELNGKKIRHQITGKYKFCTGQFGRKCSRSFWGHLESSRFLSTFYVDHTRTRIVKRRKVWFPTVNTLYTMHSWLLSVQVSLRSLARYFENGYYDRREGHASLVHNH